MALSFGLGLGDVDVALALGLGLGDVDVALSFGLGLGDVDVALALGLGLGDVDVALALGLGLSDVDVALSLGLGLGNVDVALALGLGLGDVDVALSLGLRLGDVDVAVTLGARDNASVYTRGGHGRQGHQGQRGGTGHGDKYRLFHIILLQTDTITRGTHEKAPWRRPRPQQQSADMSPFCRAYVENKCRHRPSTCQSLLAAIVSCVGACNAISAANGAPLQPVSQIIRQLTPSIVSLSVKAIKPAAPSEDGKPVFAQTVDARTGTGFFLNTNGVIVTNRHVIEGAYDIEVKLDDGRRRKATLIGAASGFDVALIKVAVDKPAVPARLGDSDKLAVGDTVIAIGSALGFESTVTSGVVSAVRRALDVNDVDEFIQTDASINLGNSGGPLFNADGEVVGINTVITATSKAGGSVGIGFAIPLNDVRFIIDQADRPDAVKIGWSGVKVQTVTTDLADALKLTRTNGVIVATMISDGPAVQAGLRQGDIIQDVEGRPVATSQGFNRLLAGASGRNLALNVWRDGQTVSLKLAVRESPQPLWATPSNHDVTQPRRRTIQNLGLVLDAMRPDLGARFHLSPDSKGVIVSALSAEGFAARAGLKEGDLIRSVQLAKIMAPPEFQAKLEDERRAGRQSILLLVERDNDETWVVLDIGSAGDRP